MKDSSIIKSTHSGRLYTDNKDFFNQSEIQEMIEKLKASSIYKKIKEKNSTPGNF